MATELEIAWAAGLFEGEGSVTHTKTSCLRLSLAMTDCDVIERFHRIAAVGSLGGWQGEAPRKYAYQWYVDGDAAASWLRVMLPYLGERRSARARTMLAERDVFVATAISPRACEQCATIFVPVFSAGRRKRFCSALCRSAAHNARVRLGKVAVTCL